MTSDPRAVVVGGLANARDLGGLPLAAGGVTPSGAFIRSERPDLVAAEGWARLGVSAVLDLRQPEERASHRSRLPARVADLHVDHDGLADHPEFWAGFWDNGLVGTPLYYLPHLAALPERTVAVLSAIATAPPGTVLFHCGLGRDRTGLIAAVLLRVAGATDDAIVADYLATIAHAGVFSPAFGRPTAEATIVEFLAARGWTSESAFRAFLGGLDAEALLARLPEEQASAIRTWRGALPPR